jgi:hypothetical protein
MLKCRVNDVVKLKDIKAGEKYGKITARANAESLANQTVKIEKVDEFQYRVKTKLGINVFINDEMIFERVNTEISEDDLYDIIAGWFSNGYTRDMIFEMVNGTINRVIEDKFRKE